MTIPTDISEFVLNGEVYVIIKRDLVEKVAPQLLDDVDTDEAPFVPEGDGAPLAVVRNHLNNDISMIQAWREYLGLTQAHVASKMGISQPAFRQIEKARRPRKVTLEKVANALGINVEQLS